KFARDRVSGRAIVAAVLAERGQLSPSFDLMSEDHTGTVSWKLRGVSISGNLAQRRSWTGTVASWHLNLTREFHSAPKPVAQGSSSSGRHFAPNLLCGA